MADYNILRRDRIYLAAPWVDKDKMELIARTFEAKGFSITHRWWEVDPDTAELSAQALKDYFGVVKADILVLLNTSKSEGKAVEQGIAIAEEKPIVAIGTLNSESKNIFHHLPNYTWVGSVEEAIKVMTTGKGLWHV